MNCPKCKNPIENNATICEWCGYEIVQKKETQNSFIESNEIPVKWHGFITFWLVLIIINSVLSFFVYMFPYPTLLTLFKNPDAGVVCLWIFGTINIISAILLLRKKKIGFYIYVVSAVLATIASVILQENILSILGGGVSIILMYFILRIKNNGATGWSMLK